MGAVEDNTHHDLNCVCQVLSLSPASGVIAVTVLLSGAVPAELETVTVMVYLLPGSSPVVV